MYSSIQQLSAKAELRECGDDARVAGEKAISQLHWRETFILKQMSELTDEQRLKILQSHIFIVKKRDGVTKARVVAGGNLQCSHVTKGGIEFPHCFYRVSSFYIESRLS